MNSTTSAMVTAVFRRRAEAEQAWRAARDLGYRDEDINLMLSEETRERLFAGAATTHTELTDKAAQAAEEPQEGADKVGGPAGASVGTIAPAIAAVSALMLIPGGVLAAGPLAVALTAAGAVGVAGGLIGALTNWGISKPRVEMYESAIRGGGVLMGVAPKSPEDAQRLADAWKRSGGEMVHL